MKKIIYTVIAMLMLTIAPISSAEVVPQMINAQCEEGADSCIWKHKDFLMEVVYECNPENHSGFLSFSIECEDPYIQAIDESNDETKYLEFTVDDIKLQSNLAIGTEADENIDQSEVLKKLINKRSFPVLSYSKFLIKNKKEISSASQFRLVNFDFAQKFIQAKKDNYYNEAIMPKIIGISIGLILLIIIIFVGIKVSKLKLNDD